MGRGRGKGKRFTVTSHEDPGSGGEEPVPTYRRRGRPTKPMKDDIDEEDVEKIEEDDGDDVKPVSPVKETKGLQIENGRKRRRNPQLKENSELVAEENGTGVKSNPEELAKSSRFRQNGNRRKSKPRRAAEAGVECK